MFLVFVLACSVLAWRVQETNASVNRERAERIKAVCKAENHTRAGILKFLHDSIVVTPGASAVQRAAIVNFLTDADKEFAPLDC